MQVSSLHIYPIKSCGGITVDSMELSSKGPLHDREWMIVKPNGGFLTGRNKPELLTVQLQYVLNGEFFEVSLPGSDSKLYLPIDHTLAPILKNSLPTDSDKKPLELNEKQVRVWKVHCAGEDLGDEASKFFSDFLDMEVRLVRTTPRVAARKVCDDVQAKLFFETEDPDDLVGFADGFPYLLTVEASLDDLNSRIDGKTLPMKNFRPNIVIKGAEPWAEDSMDKVKIGDYSFSSCAACARCKMTTIDQESGTFGGAEPLQTLESFRRQKVHEEIKTPGLIFGKNLYQLNGDYSKDNTIKVGDTFTVSNYSEIPQHIPK